MSTDATPPRPAQPPPYYPPAAKPKSAAPVRIEWPQVILDAAWWVRYSLIFFWSIVLVALVIAAVYMLVGVLVLGATARG